MESKLELLCHSAGLSYNKFIRLNKADAKQATVSQVLKPARYNLPFIILLYLITVLGLILPYHGILAESAKDESDLLVTSRNGAVSSDVTACSKYGVEILKVGGSAVDAAISTSLCLGTYNPFASGLGGGGFMVVTLPNGTSLTINFRETAPRAANRDMFNDHPLSAQSRGLAVAVPGEIAGFEMAHRLLGRLEWSKLFKDMIDLNQKGFLVTPRLERKIRFREREFLKNQTMWAWILNDSKEKGKRHGELIQRPALAQTLRLIAEDGSAAFYKGRIAQSLVRVVQENGGILTMEDMDSYQAVLEDTIKTRWLGRDVITCGPPCSGPALLQGLNIVEKMGIGNASDINSWHKIVEAMKWLSAGRTDLGDASISPDQVYFEELWTKAYTAQICRSISDVATEPWKHYHPSYMPNEPKGTSSLSVLDKDGMAVALTTTINLDFGSMLYDIESGIVLNSEMDDFSIPLARNAYNLEPSVYNEVAPKKRPLSSCAPTIILKDGLAELIIGGSGGSQIVTSIFMSIVKFYKWGWPLLEVIRSPRVHHQLIPEVVYAEHGLPEWVSEGLKTKGHMVCRQEAGSVVQAIARTGVGEILAVSDWWRKDGKSAGY